LAQFWFFRDGWSDNFGWSDSLNNRGKMEHHLPLEKRDCWHFWRAGLSGHCLWRFAVAREGVTPGDQTGLTDALSPEQSRKWSRTNWRAFFEIKIAGIVRSHEKEFVGFRIISQADKVTSVWYPSFDKIWVSKVDGPHFWGQLFLNREWLVTLYWCVDLFLFKKIYIYLASFWHEISEICAWDN
jgi:hypothetical protein